MRDLSDKQYDGQLIDEYYRLKDIREAAVKEETAETLKIIDKQMDQIRLKLQPLTLPGE